MAVIGKAALAAWVAGLVARADNAAVTGAARRSAVNVATMAVPVRPAPYA
jgi:hypothetical protein